MLSFVVAFFVYINDLILCLIYLQNMNILLKLFYERNGIDMKSDLRNIPKKNYLILGIVIVATLLVLYYFYMWVDVYKESKINIPIMDKYMSVINYNELEDYVIENPDTIVYVSVLENEEIRGFEKKLKNKYKNKLVEHDLLYLDITNEIIDKDKKMNLMLDYSINNVNITDVPCVLVFENGDLKSIYSISDNDYDIDKFMMYLNSIVLESDDM